MNINPMYPGFTLKNKDGTGPITIRKAKPNEIAITQVSQ